MNSLISIAWVDFSSIALSSSGENWTYLSLENSKPLIMSSRSTFSPSEEQMYCCFKRDPHFLCSRLKEMALCGCEAKKSFTGMETRPKEMVPDAMARAGIHPLYHSS